MIDAAGRYLYCLIVAPIRVQEIHERMEKLDGRVEKLSGGVVRVETIVDRCPHCSPPIILGSDS